MDMNWSIFGSGSSKSLRLSGYCSKLVGYMIVIGGSALLAGMLYTALVQLGTVEDIYLTPSVMILPIVLIIVSIPTIITGVRLLRVKRKRLKKGYL